MSEEPVQMRPSKKASRFAKRKKDRAKRARSDGFVLGQSLAASDEDEDGQGTGNCDKPEESDATIFLWWIRNPTVQSLGKLCRAIKCSDADWMKEFLEFDGLGLLFQCLRQLTEVRTPHLSDMVLRMECTMCIREVANSKIGLDCLLRNKHRRDNIFGRRFAAVLENRNPIVKIQIFELMSALCLYSKDGYYLTLDALEKYKSWQKYQYRFSLLLNELRHADHAAYKVSILALINAIIFANENIQDRMRIRNEFLALHIEETVTAVCETDTNPDFQIQWEVFQDEMTADREAIEETKEGVINVNNHQELFQAIFNRVRDSPISAAFLSILQSMFQINASLTQSEPIWNLLEREVRHLLSNEMSLPNSLNSSRRSSVTSTVSNSVSLILNSTVQHEDKSIQTESTKDSEFRARLQRRMDSISEKSGFPKPKITDLSNEDSQTGPNIGERGSQRLTKMPVPPPPPPLPPFLQPSSTSGPPLPPPLPPSFQSPPSSGPPPPPPLPPFLQSHPSSGVPPTPPPLPPSFRPLSSLGPPRAPPPPPPLPPPHSSTLQGSEPRHPPPPPPTPPPPVPTITLSNSGPPPPPQPPPLLPNNPGQAILRAPQPFFPQIAVPEPECKMRPFSWNKVQPTTISDVSVWNDVLTMKDPLDMEYKKLEELFCQKENVAPEKEKSPIRTSMSSEITLIDPKKSMNLNIFLKQFRRTNKEIIEIIKKADVRAFGVEKLKSLIKLLPQQDEIDLIENFDGNIEKLGTAEKFYHLLIQLPAFRCRLEAMLLVGDFNSQLAMIRPNIHLLNTVCGRLTDNVSLRKFLRLILHAGNFLNKGTSSGNAVGFRINSLNKLVMIRSNVAHLSLLHYLVEQAEHENKDALKFVDELLEPLQKAVRISLENMKSEFKQLKANVARVHQQLKTVDEEVAGQFTEFMEDSEVDLEEVQTTMDRLDARLKRLAQHYCENERTFKVTEFLESFREFCEKVKTCQQENAARIQLAQKAEQRKKAQAEIMERRKGLIPKVEDRKIVDNLVSEIRRGKVLRRLSMRKKNNLVSTEREIKI